MIVLFLVFVVQFSVSCACLAINKEQQVSFFFFKYIYVFIFLPELNLLVKSGCDTVSFGLRSHLNHVGSRLWYSGVSNWAESVDGREKPSLLYFLTSKRCPAHLLKTSSNFSFYLFCFNEDPAVAPPFFTLRGMVIGTESSFRLKISRAFQWLIYNIAVAFVLFEDKSDFTHCT